jgi:hypothetical protein
MSLVVVNQKLLVLSLLYQFRLWPVTSCDSLKTCFCAVREDRDSEMKNFKKMMRGPFPAFRNSESVTAGDPS